jgi:hypothetical protein
VRLRDRRTEHQHAVEQRDASVRQDRARPKLDDRNLVEVPTAACAGCKLRTTR